MIFFDKKGKKEKGKKESVSYIRGEGRWGLIRWKFNVIASPYSHKKDKILVVQELFYKIDKP